MTSRIELASWEIQNWVGKTPQKNLGPSHSLRCSILMLTNHGTNVKVRWRWSRGRERGGREIDWAKIVSWLKNWGFFSRTLRVKVNVRFFQPKKSISSVGEWANIDVDNHAKYQCKDRRILSPISLNSEHLDWNLFHPCVFPHASLQTRFKSPSLGVFVKRK